MLLGFLLLLGLLIFIILDGYRLRNTKADRINRGAIKRGLTPRKTVDWKVCFLMSVIAGALAFMEWKNPSGPPFTERSRWLYKFAYNAFGERGTFALLVLFCAALACFGLFFWQRSRKAGDGAARRQG